MSGNKGGAPEGNRNAVRHGFYSKVLNAADQVAIEEAAEVAGLDDEVAIMRWKIRQLLENDPDNIELQMEALTKLSRLLKARYDLSAEQKDSLKEAMLRVLTDVAIPLGIKFIPGAPH